MSSVSKQGNGDSENRAYMPQLSDCLATSTFPLLCDVYCTRPQAGATDRPSSGKESLQRGWRMEQYKYVKLHSIVAQA